MRGKKGVSGVVSTILIIVLIIVVLGVIGSIIFSFVNQGTSQFSTSKFTVRTDISSAEINFSTGIASIRVARDLGMGNLVGLKFIFEDARSSEVFDVEVAGFDELEERTFDVNLVSQNSSLQLFDIEKVSVAPVILLESGEEVIGTPSDIVSGLNSGLNETSLLLEEDNDEICTEDADCGTNYYVNGTEYCSGDDIHQYQKVYSCILGFCDDSLEDTFIETCPFECFDGSCVEDSVQCTPETVAEDCGTNGFVGLPSCAVGGIHKVIQDYKEYSCVNSTCDLTITSTTIEECNESEVCFNAECFVPLECTQHSDCDPGEICVEGECVIEATVNSGVIASIWPFGIGEYFDSPDLSDPENDSWVNYFIVFPAGSQDGCLEISEHKVPNVTGAAPYVRLNETVTNISSSDSFQIWETNYVCSLY